MYAPPAGITAVPNTTITSSQFNNAIGDITQDLNTPRPIASGGTGSTTASAARTALGLGSMAVQPKSGVDITGGAINGVTIGDAQPARITGTLIIAGTAFRAPADDGFASPGYSWLDSPDSGMFLLTDESAIGWSVVGTVRAYLGNDLTLLNGGFRAFTGDGASHPGHSWQDAIDYGMFLLSDKSQIGWSLNGVAKAYLGDGFTLLDGSVKVTAGGPGGSCNYSFIGQAGTGMHYFNGSDTLNLMRGGTPRLQVGSNYVAMIPDGTTEVARALAGGAFCVGVSDVLDLSTSGGFGFSANTDGTVRISRAGGPPLIVRRSNEGAIAQWWLGATLSASMSFDAGGTLTYGTFCGAHWSQGPVLPPGTIVETIDELTDWSKDEFPSILPKYQPASAGSRGVYGVWSHLDDDGDPFIAGLGAYKIRIKAGVTVQLHDLITCGGDGLGVPQADDAIRSSTVGKVTATTVLETLPDGSFLVPAVLYCG